MTCPLLLLWRYWLDTVWPPTGAVPRRYQVVDNPGRTESVVLPMPKPSPHDLIIGLPCGPKFRWELDEMLAEAEAERDTWEPQ